MTVHTKTFVQYDAWASTTPWDCLVRDTGCISPTHDHDPMVGDVCAEPQCDERLRDREVCYAVFEFPRVDGRERWVCWRHVRADEGPIRIPRDD